MEIRKLQFIKNAQKEYLSLFGEKLEIDWNLMNKIEDLKYSPIGDFDKEVIMSKIDELCKKHSITFEQIYRNSTPGKRKTNNEINFLNEYFVWARYNKYNTGKICEVINRDRTLYYYYDKKNKQEATGKKQEEGR